MEEFAFLVGIFMGLFIGFVFGCVVTHDHFTERLVEAELAEYTIDPTSGDTTFIIYAEQPTK